MNNYAVNSSQYRNDHLEPQYANHASQGYQEEAEGYEEQVVVQEENRDTMKSVNVEDMSGGDALLNLSQLDSRDLKIAISKLRGQNEGLREQLRDLSSKLTEVLDKSRTKPKLKEDRPQEFKEDTLIKEIENSKQQITQYKKEMEHLRNRLELCSSEDRITKLEVILKQRSQMLDDLTIENKNLQKINRDQEKEIDAYYRDQGFEHKVNSCTEEVKSLREKMRDVQEVSRTNEKNFKKQQEYLTNLNHQYALVCERVGIPTSLTFTKPDELNEHLRKNGKGDVGSPNRRNFQSETIMRVDLDPKQLKAMQEKIQDLQNKEEIMQKQLQSLDRKNQITLTKIKADISDAQREAREIEAKLRDKEKEVSDLDRRVADLKRSAKKNATSMLDPLRAESEKAFRDASPRQIQNASSPIRQVPNRPEVYPGNATSPKNKAKVPEVKEIPMVRDVMGGRSGQGLYEFTDKDIFENQFSTKIVKITVWIGEAFINGIQASYRLNNVEDIMGNQHLAGEMKTKTKIVESLQIDPDDYISLIGGKYSEGLVTIKFQTAKGKIKVFGNPKNSGEEFEIQMQDGEQPTLMFGALCKKKDKKGKEEIILANVGFTLMKKVRAK